MNLRVDNAINKEIKPSFEKPVLELKEDEKDQELNSEDDISDYNEVFDTGNNILLGYYVKVS